MPIKQFLLFPFIVFVALNSNAQFKTRKISKEESEYKTYLTNLTPCQTLQKLSNKDSISQLKKMHQFDECIGKIVDTTGIKTYYIDESFQYPYISYSLDKSIYKINLMQWMRQLGCSDTAKLKATTKGNFCEEELRKIKGLEKLHVPIDTNIIMGNSYKNNLQRKIKEEHSCVKKSTAKKINNLTECEILNKLSNPDSTNVIGKNFENYLFFLMDKSGIKMDFDERDFVFGYTNTSLKKSLYKLNLIQWANYFNCPCKSILLSIKGGDFTASELRYIENQNKMLNYIDTTILH